MGCDYRYPKYKPGHLGASGSGVSQSGVINYLNKFGEYGKNYMTYDNVGELYYAALRYFENLGNVTEWSNSLTTAELDGFPAATTWTDPIAYSCQKNFVLGIGDDHTWYDYNVGGATNASGPPRQAFGGHRGHLQPGYDLDDEHADS